MQGATAQWQPVQIVLEQGAVFEGLGFGNFVQPRCAEFVFCTAMTGLEESLTDPSFCGQALVSTLSHTGNTGSNGEDEESAVVWAEGLITRHLCDAPSSWRATGTLLDLLSRHHRFVVQGVNTRLLTQVLRDQGSQQGAVFLAKDSRTESERLAWLRSHKAKLQGDELLSKVSRTKIELLSVAPENATWPYHSLASKNIQPGFQPAIGVWDFGVKENTLRLLSAMGSSVTVFPASTKAQDILEFKHLQGLVLSNGPGDPMHATHVQEELKRVIGRLPIFAICLGHQLSAIALGAKTYKLKFGHRGIHHPVVELDSAGVPLRTWITSQNHGFAVDADSLPPAARVHMVHADDASLEGFVDHSKNIQSVQFHPEAAPGPTEGANLLQQWMETLKT